MSNQKLKRLLNTFLGIAWSLLTFGTTFTFAFTIINSSIPVVLISTFIVFFISGIVVLFLESLKVQISQSEDIKRVLDELEKREKELNVTEQ